MAIFSVLVRDYHWSKNDYRVQSPNLDLRSAASNLIIRPLQGNNKDEPWIVDTISDLRDDIQGEAYQTEAHGVFISATSEADYFPVWVPIQGDSVGSEDNKIYVVNLKTFEGLTVAVAEICWIPTHEGPDGSLYTVIGTSRKMGHDKSVMVLIQHPGLPDQVRFNILAPSVFSGYVKLDSARKQKLFDWQFDWHLIARNGKYRFRGEVMQLASQIFLSPYRHDDGRSPFRKVLDGSKWRLWEDFLDVKVDTSDFNSTYDNSSRDRVGASSQRYNCRCTYSDLGPTLLNPQPPHRHVKDDECPLGSAHSKHCIFAGHLSMHCVIPNSGKPHEHCHHLELSLNSGSPTQTDVSTNSTMATAIDTTMSVMCSSEMDALQSELENQAGGSISEEVDRLYRTSDADASDTIDLEATGFESALTTPQPIPNDADTSTFLSMDTESIELDNSPEIHVDHEAMDWPIRRLRADRGAYSSPGLPDIQM
ncbi:hypothetical protein F5X99DRAFT_259915 [Biscogniauxia marginata]|nr:hypothetical protein F5X99DRAFT_259915 [Biscogniauxia marginata]